LAVLVLGGADGLVSLEVPSAGRFRRPTRKLEKIIDLPCCCVMSAAFIFGKCG